MAKSTTGGMGGIPPFAADRDWTPIARDWGPILDDCIKGAAHCSLATCSLRRITLSKPWRANQVSIAFFMDIKTGEQSPSPLFSLAPTFADKENCYLCKQTRPCCRQSLFELGERGHHEKMVHPIQGPLREAWGLGSVWVTCCNKYHGMYYDIETKIYKPMYLGDSEEQALARVNHIKSFLWTNQY